MTITLTQETQLSITSPAIGKTYGELSKQYGIRFLQPVMYPGNPISASTLLRAGYIRVTGEWDKVNKFIKYADV